MVQRISTLRTTFCPALPTNIFAGILTAVPTGPCVIWKCCWLDGREGKGNLEEAEEEWKHSHLAVLCVKSVEITGRHGFHGPIWPFYVNKQSSGHPDHNMKYNIYINRSSALSIPSRLPRLLICCRQFFIFYSFSFTFIHTYFDMTSKNIPIDLARAVLALETKRNESLPLFVAILTEYIHFISLWLQINRNNFHPEVKQNNNEPSMHDQEHNMMEQNKKTYNRLETIHYPYLPSLTVDNDHWHISRWISEREDDLVRLADKIAADVCCSLPARRLQWPSKSALYSFF